MPRCPWRLIEEAWDSWLSTVLDLHSDITAGCPPRGWPDRFSAPIVEAVRYLRRESQAAEAEMMEAARGKIRGR